MFLILFSYECFAPKHPTANIAIVYPTVRITYDEIKAILKEYDIKHADIVLAQIRLETGNLSSTISRKNKNLFGMKYPRKRETTAIGEYLGHAKYKTYADCIADYAIWQKTNYIEGDYFTFLIEVGYAKDIDYISKLKGLI